jgi:dTDP-4-dehydrorhamnose 3,5-epimerase
LRLVRVLPTRLDGPVLLEPAVHGDARGFFVESYRANVWAQHGVGDTFVQDNHSRSGRGVLRGRILDVIVDLRRASPTYADWEAHELDDERARQLYIPVGFAHGFCVLSEIADVTYKCSTYYDGAIERGFHYADPDVGIAWPDDVELLVSERDRTAPPLSAIAGELPF